MGASQTGARTTEEELPRVREGVFFEPLQALPRGRHSLTSEQVQAIQRERILVAMTELMAVHGPRAFGAGEIARRAGVSLAAFYEGFEGKEDCAIAGYDRFIEGLFHSMNAVDVGDKTRPELVCGLIDAYLSTLQSDLVVARAYQVKIDELGAAVRERRRNSLLLFAHHLWGVSSDDSPSGRGPEVLPWSAYIGVIYTTRQLASDLLETEEEPDLMALSAELAIWVSDLFR